MSQKVREVARAIWDSFQHDKNKPENDNQFLLDNRLSLLRGGGHGFAEGLWDQAARAAIAAMREPTEKMIAAGTVGWDALDGSGIRPMFAPQRPWRAMIDAAMKETP